MILDVHSEMDISNVGVVQGPSRDAVCDALDLFSMV